MGFWEQVEELSGQKKAQELPTSHQICLMLANLYYQGEPHKAHCKLATLSRRQKPMLPGRR